MCWCHNICRPRVPITTIWCNFFVTSETDLWNFSPFSKVIVRWLMMSSRWRVARRVTKDRLENQFHSRSTPFSILRCNIIRTIDRTDSNVCWFGSLRTGGLVHANPSHCWSSGYNSTLLLLNFRPAVSYIWASSTLGPLKAWCWRLIKKVISST